MPTGENHPLDEITEWFIDLGFGLKALACPHSPHTNNTQPAAAVAMGNVWSAAGLQVKSPLWVGWSAQMYQGCLRSQAPGHNGVRASLVYKVGRT